MILLLPNLINIFFSSFKKKKIYLLDFVEKLKYGGEGGLGGVVPPPGGGISNDIPGAGGSKFKQA